MKTITGKVMDAENDLPLAGASVIIVDRYKQPLGAGTLTDANGMFKISSALFDDPYNNLEISFVSYRSEFVRPLSGNFYLSAEGSTLGTVYVIAKKFSKEHVTAAKILTVLFIVLAIYAIAKIYKFKTTVANI